MLFLADIAVSVPQPPADLNAHPDLFPMTRERSRHVNCAQLGGMVQHQGWPQLIAAECALRVLDTIVPSEQRHPLEPLVRKGLSVRQVQVAFVHPVQRDASVEQAEPARVHSVRPVDTVVRRSYDA